MRPWKLLWLGAPVAAIAHGCGGIAVSPAGETEGGAGGGAWPGGASSAGGQLADGGTADPKPCDPDTLPPADYNEKHSCCGGVYCRGDCLEEGDAQVCDCGGMIGGCPSVKATCCLAEPQELGLWICDPCYSGG